MLETYVIFGPLFYFYKATELIGSEDDNGVTLPIPHAYFKSILTENNRGTLNCGLSSCLTKTAMNLLNHFLFQL